MAEHDPGLAEAGLRRCPEAAHLTLRLHDCRLPSYHAGDCETGRGDSPWALYDDAGALYDASCILERLGAARLSREVYAHARLLAAQADGE